MVPRLYSPARNKGAAAGPETNVARKLKSDKVLFIATILLVSVSVVMVYSASAVLAAERWDEPYRFLMRQGLWAAMGLAMLAIAMRIDYRTYKNESFIWAVIAVVGFLRSTGRGAGSVWAVSASSRPSWPRSPACCSRR
jgi:cell division protein FtsW (lipid II flippase)